MSTSSIPSMLDNSTSSASSSSPFLSTGFRMQNNSHNDIPMQDMRSTLERNNNGEFEDPPLPEQGIFKSRFNIFSKTETYPSKTRNIYLNNHQMNQQFKFTNNYVKTSKYTALTFLPLNLFEQFCRLANLYFLLISAIQLIPGISPTGRFTTLGPLLVVLSITALKEAYEDFRRHRQDDRINYSKAEVLRGGAFEYIHWKDIQVGDIVRVVNRQYFPADLVVLATSEPQSCCYIETVNLDGETNLKIKQGLEETQFLADINNFGTLNASIECEHPNNRLYNYVGTLYLDDKVYPLSVKQVLLRGSMLRNTKWIYGAVVFSGKDTKLVRNSRAPPIKRSGVERTTNFYVLFIFVFQIFLCTACAITNAFWNANNEENWYLMWTRPAAEEGALSFLTFLILFNNLIPISLYVSMEFVKLFQAHFINNDLQMYHAENDTPAQARTSNLNEELGQIEYIFSDKTGTLTQNKMEFKRCSIGGVCYGNMGMTDTTVGRMMRESNLSSSQIKLDDTLSESEQSGVFDDPRFFKDLNSDNQLSKVIREFVNVLAVCHTVIPEIEDGKTVFQASSPDEHALVTAAKQMGFVFASRTPKSIIVHAPGNVEQRFEVLNILEFNSFRKRMSVIVRHPDGRIVLYCKGADTVIYERLSPNQPYADSTISHLQAFATDGLRTLCLAYVELNPTNYEKWAVEHARACSSVVNRENDINRSAELIERGLFLLGATAIEDKLQDGVPETITILRKAGLKIFVLTGDKQETAINIGFSAQLLTHEMELMVINEESRENTMIEMNRRLEEIFNPDSGLGPENLGLIIDGNTLMFAMEESARLLLTALISRCKIVICCRVSPLQKAQVVRLVREDLSGITLAIGDGANDVSMIQAAHVGVGISGEEGLQAARSSDYSIAQFRFLQRLLLIHGRYSYRRITKLICYCFYKNIALYLTQFCFTAMNGWSGQTYYERLTLTAYNIAWTFFPVIVMGVLDKDVSEEMVMEHPQLYNSGIRNELYNIKVFGGWAVTGLLHALLLYIFPTYVFYHSLAYTNGLAVDLFTVGTVAYSCVIITVNLKLALEIHYWTWVNHLTVWGSIIIYFIWLLAFGKFWEFESLDVGSDLYSIIYRIGQSVLFYLTIVLVPILCLYKDITFKFAKRTLKPRPYHIVQEIEKKSSKAKDPNANTNSIFRKKKLYTGYSFSQDAGQADIVNKKYSA
eukprot:gene3848-4443_t